MKHLAASWAAVPNVLSSGQAPVTAASRSGGSGAAQLHQQVQQVQQQHEVDCQDGNHIMRVSEDLRPDAGERTARALRLPRQQARLYILLAIHGWRREC